MDRKYGTAEAYDRFLPYDEPPKTAVFSDFSGGMTKDISLLLNMEAKDGRLCSVSAPKDAVYENGFAQGTVCDAKYADGVFLFRKGRTLYALKDGAFSIVGTEGMLAEESGEIYDYKQKFYVVDEETIYAVDRDLDITAVEQEVPVCFTDVRRNGTDYTEVAPMNPFCRYIDVWLSDEEENEQTFPSSWAVDYTYVRAWHKDGREVYNPYIMKREDRFIFDGDDAAGCRMRLRLLDSADESQYSFSSAEPYRAVFQSPAAAFFVTLSDGNAMLLAAKDTEVIGAVLQGGFGSHRADGLIRYDCFQTITGIVPFDDGYLLFFEDSVRKLLIEDQGGTVSFSVFPFKNDFGSDMADSIVCFDDKIVFASAKGGVFCIDRYGVSERVGSRKISANIESGEYGFFSHTAEEYRGAAGFAAFGKYYLTVGDVTYVWDHRAKLPTDVQTHRDEREMVWHLCDTVRAERFLILSEGKLYYAEKDTDAIRYMERGGGAGAVCLRTGELDFGSSERKVLIECGIRYRSAGAVSLSLSCGGNPFIEAYCFPASSYFVTKRVRTYGKRFDTLSLRAESEGDMEIEALIFRFL